mgnify:FL=1
MISLERVIEIFIAEGFDIFNSNDGSVQLVYLPDSMKYQGRLITISYDDYQQGKCIFPKFKIASKNYRPQMSYDYGDVVDFNTISETDLQQKVHDLMQEAILINKQIIQAKRTNKIKKDF